MVSKFLALDIFGTQYGVSQGVDTGQKWNCDEDLVSLQLVKKSTWAHAYSVRRDAPDLQRPHPGVVRSSPSLPEFAHRWGRRSG